MKIISIRIDELDQQAGGYPITLLDSAAGGSPAVALLPDSLSLDGLAETFTAEEMRQRFLNAGGPDTALLNIGEQLYKLLAQGQIGQRLQGLGPQTRVLLDIRPAELKNLPWELLSRNQLRLFSDWQRPYLRGHTAGTDNLDPHEWPLRVLIVIASRAGDPDVQAEQELERLTQAFISADPDMDVLVLRRPSKADLLTRLREFKPHIFHFVGHGEVLAGEAALLLFNERTMTNEPWTPGAIRNEFNLPDPPRFVFINACRSNSAGQNGLWSVTDAFLEAGIPAVLGIRTNIAGEDAVRFSSGFYTALCERKAIDIAVAEGRRQVFEAHADGLMRRDWAAPSLHVRAAPDSIIRVGEGIDADQREFVVRLPDFSRLRGLVNRHLERRDAWLNLAIERQNILVVEGEEGVGKTRFAALLMERCLLRELEVRYVDINRQRGDFLTLLRLIRDGDGSQNPSLIRQPLHNEAFRSFNRQVNEILGVTIPETENSDRDQMAQLTPGAYSSAGVIFEQFRTSLVDAIPRPPLILVIDHLDTLLAHEFTDFLRPHFFDWCLNRPDIVVVLLLTPTQAQRFQIDLIPQFYRLPIASFPREEWNALAIEWVHRNMLAPYDQARDFVDFFGQRLTPQWKPGVLETMGELLEAVGVRRK